LINLLALLPIAVVLVLMVGRSWSAAQAGGVGALVAYVIAAGAFGFPAATGDGGAVREVAGVLAETGFTAVTILWIIGPALGTHQLQVRIGAAETLRSALGAFASDPRILALLVAWFFVLFMEGVAGFGSSVVLAAPFLVAAGLRPVEAVSIALVGHVAGVSFGAIGTPIIPQMAATGISGRELAAATGIYHSLLGWIPLAIMVRWVDRSGIRGDVVAAPAPTGRSRPTSIRGWTLLAFLCCLVPYTLLWRFVGPELPTVGGALFGGALFVLLLALAQRSGSQATRPPGPVVPASVVLHAAAPYLALVALVLLTRLVPWVRATPCVWWRSPGRSTASTARSFRSTTRDQWSWPASFWGHSASVPTSGWSATPSSIPAAA